ncbi:MAG: hypothetical protein HRT35_32100 [Algicola sp.]|nr:hypothetical protein [Algicola sp.]
MYGVILDAANTITVGSPYTFSAFAVAEAECLLKTYTFSIDNVIRGYNLSGLFSYTFDQPGQHSVQVTAECSCGGYFKWDGMSVDAQCPNTITGVAGSCVTYVGINAPSKLTLLDDYTLSATIQPTSAKIDNYHFQIKRGETGSWYTLYEGSESTFSDYAKVAGHFKIRLKVTANNKVYTAAESALEMQFPTYGHIVGDSAFLAKTVNVWTDILAETNELWRREQGFWIMVNTKTRQYEFGAIIYGARAGKDERAGLVLRYGLSELVRAKPIIFSALCAPIMECSNNNG